MFLVLPTHFLPSSPLPPVGRFSVLVLICSQLPYSSARPVLATVYPSDCSTDSPYSQCHLGRSMFAAVPVQRTETSAKCCPCEYQLSFTNAFVPDYRDVLPGYPDLVAALVSFHLIILISRGLSSRTASCMALCLVELLCLGQTLPPLFFSIFFPCPSASSSSSSSSSTTSSRLSFAACLRPLFLSPEHSLIPSVQSLSIYHGVLRLCRGGLRCVRSFSPGLGLL